jgi:hypothetical protein
MKRALIVSVLVLTMSSTAVFAQSTQSSPNSPTVRGGGVTVTIDKDRATPPDGDPRSTDQRREDRVAFNKCVLTVRDRDSGMLGRASPGPDPLLYCQQRLGMTNADAVPNSVKVGAE